ncbi:MAG: response regulator transcription factor [Ghiorsea sp.]
MTTTLIIDDHPLFRDSLSSVLKKLGTAGEDHTIFQAEDALSALKIISTHNDIDLIVTDIEMPGMDGITLLQELEVILPKAIKVIISGSERASDVKRALKLGAKGFIQKNAETPILLAALQLIMAGGTYIPPLILRTQKAIADQPDPTITLTDRQMEILTFLQQGQQNKVIAHTLDLSEATVKVHVRHIFSVLGVKNRTQAVQKAQEIGIL